MDQPEHALQVRLVGLCREQVAEPHKLLAHDRSKARGRFTHMREKARGLVAGEADFELVRRVGLPLVFPELKIHPNKPSAEQIAFGADMTALGHVWFVAYTATEFVDGLRAAGVALRGTADWAAAEIDAKAPAAPKRRASSSRPRVEKATKAELRFNELRYRRP